MFPEDAVSTTHIHYRKIIIYYALMEITLYVNWALELQRHTQGVSQMLGQISIFSSSYENKEKTPFKHSNVYTSVFLL